MVYPYETRVIKEVAKSFCNSINRKESSKGIRAYYFDDAENKIYLTIDGIRIHVMDKDLFPFDLMKICEEAPKKQVKDFVDNAQGISLYMDCIKVDPVAKGLYMAVYKGHGKTIYIDYSLLKIFGDNPIIKANPKSDEVVSVYSSVKDILLGGIMTLKMQDPIDGSQE